MAEIALVTKTTQAVKGQDHVLLLAPRKALKDGVWSKVLGESHAAALEAMVASTEPGALGKCVTTWPGAKGGPARLTLGVLPDLVSRHCSPSRNHAIADCCAKAGLEGSKVGIVLVLDDAAHWLPAAVAIGRAFRLYQRKSTTKAPPAVTLAAVDRAGEPLAPPDGVEATLAATRWVAALVDRPTDEKSTADVVEAARALAGGPGVKVKTIVGQALVASGLRGVHAVGRAAEVEPRLLVLESSGGEKGSRPGKSKKKPAGEPLVIALVGKGIVFDTGGLHIKPRGSMEGMKSDMGGAAAVVAAFHLLVREGCPHRLLALVPLAENAVGPRSYRPDEILTLHSGKTVEINNTDAEGRLLLADAVSYAGRVLEADLIVDAATLTGAQGISTGKRHAAVVSNRAGLEALAVEAGRRSGDLVHPLPFAPELYQAEFKSELADMTNSVKDRNNAQSSCAAQFIYEHIRDLDRPWLHVDLASPAHVDGKGTGYGAALLAEVVRSVEPAHLRE